MEQLAPGHQRLAQTALLRWEVAQRLRGAWSGPVLCAPVCVWIDVPDNDVVLVLRGWAGPHCAGRPLRLELRRASDLELEGPPIAERSVGIVWRGRKPHIIFEGLPTAAARGTIEAGEDSR